MIRNYEFWPFLEDADDWVYGPITPDTTPVVKAESLEDAAEKLPDPPEGCIWGLVGIF